MQYGATISDVLASLGDVLSSRSSASFEFPSAAVDTGKTSDGNSRKEAKS
jgi:hypothetical protein